MRSLKSKAIAGLFMAVTAILLLPGGALARSAEGEAQKTLGAPYPEQWGLTSAADTIKVHVDWFHRLLEVLITVITLIVFGLLVYVVIRFRASKNPVPSRRTHNLPLEFLWTLIPSIIVFVMLFPSISLMYYMDKAKNPELTVKITGHQWYWNYEFPDQTYAGQPLAIDEYISSIVPQDKLKPGQLRLLSVDQPLVLPVDTEVQFLITGADVIHSWFVPSFGVNRSAMPGRTNESWAKVTHEGVFYGQCTKICGLNHGYMPIEVHVVSKDKFRQWVAIAKASGVEKANAAILGTRTAALEPAGNTTSLASK